MITREADLMLSARANLYAFVSAMFSMPDSRKFQLLYDPAFHERVELSCCLLDQFPDDSNLSSAAENLFSFLRHLDDIEEEYGQVFGHTLSKDTAPYELEFLKNKETFSLTQTLADIQGFYRAFGLEVGQEERGDYVATEAEFMSFLIFKEKLAVEKGKAENADICREAQRDFLKEHLSGWAFIWLENVLSHPAAQFYRATAHFTRYFLKWEFRHSYRESI
ncbi:MAG TPA: molecular chaperone TorD family protein [Acidobacteriota bacterium]|nr:molecular chaperone TorD family protein [Acidobacteriota bacterium]